MSKNYNDCEIVFDLLPLYLDGKTGAESNEFVRNHLAECIGCREVHRLMSAELPKKDSLSRVGASVQETEKKVRKRKHLTRRTKRIIILLVGLIGYVCLMMGVIVAVALYLKGAW